MRRSTLAAVPTLIFGITLGMAAIIAIALMPGSMAYAEGGMLLRATDKWNVFRNPEGKTIRKYNLPSEPPKPAIQSRPATIVAPAALVITDELTASLADRDHMAFGAFYNPVAETFIPIVALSPFGTYHIAGGYSNVDETEIILGMLFAMKDFVPNRMGVYAGLSYLHMKETAKLGCAEIEASGEGGTAFGGLSVRIVDRLYLMVGISAGHMELDGSSTSCGYYEDYYRNRHAFSGNAGLLYYLW